MKNQITKPDAGKIMPGGFGEPTWLAAAREAMNDVLGAEAWTDMIRAQVDKARKGDADALKTVADLAGLTAMKSATFVQNNTHHEHYHGSGKALAPPDPLLDENPDPVARRLAESREERMRRLRREVDAMHSGEEYPSGD